VRACSSYSSRVKVGVVEVEDKAARAQNKIHDSKYTS
jgi:hypothetical protein